MKATRDRNQVRIKFPSAHGGRRRGAGRPRRGVRAAERHRRRERFGPGHPIHVTVRTVPALRELRRRDAYHAFRLALHTALRREGFRVCHISLQRGHAHLLVEADHFLALARGMQGLLISAAQRLNRALSRRLGRRRRGTVFPDRYHARVKRTPTEVHRCLRYVLCNWRRHRDDRGTRARVDPHSTAHAFDGFRDHDPGPGALDPLLPVERPRSWLLTSGWRRLGRFAARDRPGSGGA
jgi:hypothetical protein